AISLVYLAVLLALGLTVLMTIGLLRRQQLQGALRGAGSSI
ncbi:MAG: hypothetical protein KDE28_30045, partial [Anaerolineales bacterium]|nr:hypothetical protein [Anaerolineales bacterium]